MTGGKFNHIWAGLLSVLIFIACQSCGREPERVLAAVNCNAKDIKMTAAGTRLGTQATWTIIADVGATCLGAPLRDAEVNMTFWWPDSTTILKTGPNGKLRFQKVVHADPKGQTYTATIRGKDGETSISHKY